jgi:hypothetical protein
MSEDCNICGHDGRTPCYKCLRTENERRRKRLESVRCAAAVAKASALVKRLPGHTYEDVVLPKHIFDELLALAEKVKDE